jgi:hypothetical protein
LGQFTALFFGGGGAEKKGMERERGGGGGGREMDVWSEDIPPERERNAKKEKDNDPRTHQSKRLSNPTPQKL